MSSWKWTVAAAVGSGIGAAIWIALGGHFGSTLGGCALVVGLLGGVGVRIAAADSDEWLSRGLTASIVALLLIAVAKYNVASQTMVSEQTEFWESFSTVDEESMIGTLADQIILARMQRGEAILWPDEDMTYEDAVWEDDYPADVWVEAAARWRNLSPSEQQVRTAAHQAGVDRMIDYHLREPRRTAFYQSFGILDVTCMLVGLGVAFAIGGGDWMTRCAW